MVVGSQEERKLLPLSRGWHIYYIIKKGALQVVKNNFWIITLCVLLILSANIGLSVPLRVAIVANALVILIDVFRGARRLYNERHKKKN